MFLLVQWDSLEGLTTEFNAEHLNGNGKDQNDQEKRVVEEVLEYVQLSGFEFTSVNFVEDLQQDENVEEH